MPLGDRLVLMLKKLSQWRGSNTIDISYHDLAAMLGVTKEAIGVNLIALKSSGVVKLGCSKIIYLGD